MPLIRNDRILFYVLAIFRSTNRGVTKENAFCTFFLVPCLWTYRIGRLLVRDNYEVAECDLNRIGSTPLGRLFILGWYRQIAAGQGNVPTMVFDNF